MRWLIQRIDELRFRIDRWRYGEGRFWRFSEINGNQILDNYVGGQPIKLVRGRFKGTLFCYKSLTLTENGATFDYHILWGDEARIHRGAFSFVIRKIMLNLLWSTYIEGDTRLQTALKPGEEYIDEDRNHIAEEPSEKRAIRAQGHRLPEARVFHRQR